jgi:hypothetical protein
MSDLLYASSIIFWVKVIRFVPDVAVAGALSEFNLFVSVRKGDKISITLTDSGMTIITIYT